MRLIQWMFFVSSVGLVSVTGSVSLAASPELFAKGAESFKIETSKGATPTFRVLSDSLTKQALALAAISAINAQGDVTPKMPLTNYIDVKFQTLVFTPSGSTKDKLALRFKISGAPVDLDQTVSKADFLSGKSIEVVEPKTDKDLTVYNVTSQGRMKLHFDRATQTLILENVEAHLHFDTPLGDDGSESIQFAGRGRRVL